MTKCSVPAAEFVRFWSVFAKNRFLTSPRPWLCPRFSSTLPGEAAATKAVTNVPCCAWGGPAASGALLCGHRPPLDSSSRVFSTATCLKASAAAGPGEVGDGDQQVGLFKRFKKMWKDYWYVMIPVHCVTSVGWFGGFYVLCKSGVDVAALLGHFGVSDAYLEKVNSSSLGYVALAYACYKIATPVRYTVTIGGTTLAIRHLRSLGYLKTTKDIRSNMKETQVELKQKRDKLLLDFRQRKEQKRDEWVKAWEGFASKRRQKKD